MSPIASVKQIKACLLLLFVIIHCPIYFSGIIFSAAISTVSCAVLSFSVFFASSVSPAILSTALNAVFTVVGNPAFSRY